MFSLFFIKRPIFAAVISIIIVVLGLMALINLPVARYPDLAPPTIQVSAVYPGADASTISETVAGMIEKEINGVEGMIYMSSISGNDGSMNLTVTFEPGTDLDTANVLVQNRVSKAEPRLPDEVKRTGVTVKPLSLFCPPMAAWPRSRNLKTSSSQPTMMVGPSGCATWPASNWDRIPTPSHRN